MIKTVIFDLDDTLYPEKDFVLSGFGVIADYLKNNHKIGKNKVLTILKDDFENGLRRKNFNILIEKLGLPERLIKRLIKIYRNHSPNINLFSDAKKILAILKKQKYRLAIITDGQPKTQRNKISALNIQKYFKVITISDTLGKGQRKPNPKPFLITLKKLGVSAGKSIYIADNPLKDFIAPRKLGILTIRIRRGTGEYDFVKFKKENDANFIIKTLIELPNILNKIKAR